MAKPDMGTKRQCQVCGTKFFDMNRQKPVCPKCGSVFQAVAPARGAARAAAARDDDEKEPEAEVDTVPLEEADAPDDAAVVTDEAEADDEAPADDFLEEEEGDGDDVSGLIDGDIETDEEP